jgi:hypothetical protein
VYTHFGGVPIVIFGDHEVRQVGGVRNQQIPYPAIMLFGSTQRTWERVRVGSGSGSSTTRSFALLAEQRGAGETLARRTFDVIDVSALVG